MSQQSGKGRRTPLTLGQQQQQQQHHHQQHHNVHRMFSNASAGRKGSSESAQTDSSRSTAASKHSDAPSVDLMAPAVEQSVSSSGTHIVGPKSAQLKYKQKPQRAAQPVADSDDGVILIADDNDDLSDASSKRSSSKSDRRGDKSAKNGSTSSTDTAPVAANNGNGKATSAVPASPKSQQTVSTGDIIAESPRQKVLRENREKDEAERVKQQEAREIEAALAAFQAQEEKEAEKQVLRTPDKASKRQTDKQTTGSGGKASPVVVGSNNGTPKKSTPVKASPKSPQAGAAAAHERAAAAASVESDDAMESLQIEPEVEEEQAPAKAPVVAAAATETSTTLGGKILKYTLSPTVVLTRARLSPFAARRRSIEAAAGADNASTLVNLSTVSEQSNECHSGRASPAVAVAGDGGRPLFGSLRHISGRRSTRPLREMALLQQQSSASGTYRRTCTELDDANNASISSLNVTVGSDRDGDADGSGARGRKRTTAQLGGSEPDLTAASVESPKKARLDLTGIFGIIASPVTMLRNKFSRTNLLCSTPNAKKLNVDVDAEDDILAAPVEQKVDAPDAAVSEATAEHGEIAAVEELAAKEEHVAAAVVAADADVEMGGDANGADRTDLEAQIAADVSIAGGADEGCDEVILVQGEAAPGDDQNETENGAEAPADKPKKSSCSIM